MLGAGKAALLANYASFRLRRKLQGVRTLPEHAHKSWAIAPPETVTMPPTLALDGEFERIQAFQEWTTEDVERRRTYGGEITYPAVMAYEYHDAILYNGSVFAAGAEQRIRPDNVLPPEPKNHPVIDIGDGALATSFLGLKYFGHWMKDDAPLSLLAEEYGTPFVLTPPPWRHVDGYRDLLGVPSLCAENARIKKLVMFEDEPTTSHKGVRLRKMRSRVQKKLGSPKASGQRVFITRGISDKPGRIFVNEKEIADRLSRQEGFTILDPSQMGVDAFIEALYGASLIVSSEGSQSAHIYYLLQKGAGVIDITSPFRFNSPKKCFSYLLGLRFGYIVGDPANDGFSADYDRLMRTVELFGA